MGAAVGFFRAAATVASLAAVYLLITAAVETQRVARFAPSAVQPSVLWAAATVAVLVALTLWGMAAMVGARRGR
ncbi:MAG: hypothetical protein ACRD1Y_05895 [Terriglobales bacterium]